MYWKQYRERTFFFWWLRLFCSWRCTNRCAAKGPSSAASGTSYRTISPNHLRKHGSPGLFQRDRISMIHAEIPQPLGQNRCFRAQLLLLVCELPGGTRHVLGTQTKHAAIPQNNGMPYLCSAVTGFMGMPQSCSPSEGRTDLPALLLNNPLLYLCLYGTSTVQLQLSERKCWFYSLVHLKWPR